MAIVEIGRSKIRYTEPNTFNWDVPINENTFILLAVTQILLEGKRVISGLGATTLNLNVTVSNGVLLLQNGATFNVAGSVVAVPASSTGFIVARADHGDVIFVAYSALATNHVPIYFVKTSTTVVSTIGDIRAYSTLVTPALIGASATNHTHTGVYEAANANIQSHVTNVTGNPHALTPARIGAAPEVHTHNDIIPVLNNRFYTNVAVRLAGVHDEINLSNYILDYSGNERAFLVISGTGATILISPPLGDSTLIAIDAENRLYDNSGNPRELNQAALKAFVGPQMWYNEELGLTVFEEMLSGEQFISVDNRYFGPMPKSLVRLTGRVAVIGGTSYLYDSSGNGLHFEIVSGTGWTNWQLRPPNDNWLKGFDDGKLFTAGTPNTITLTQLNTWLGNQFFFNQTLGARVFRTALTETILARVQRNFTYASTVMLDTLELTEGLELMP